LIAAYPQGKRATAKPKVDLEVKVHPTISLSTDDETALKNALARYDKSLYRFEALESGKVNEERSVGTLLVDKELKAEIDQAKSEGASVFTGMSTPCGSTATSRMFTQEDADQAKALTDAILPILSKYQVSK
jgi:hypothetical protein